MDRCKMLLYLFGVFAYLCVTNVVALDAEGIKGGEYAEEALLKYQVSVLADNRPICGGAIIADNYILTAAHCFLKNDELDEHALYVIAGTNDLNTAKGKPVVGFVDAVYVHKEYDPHNVEADIAILRLSSGLGLDTNDYLDKINLPVNNYDYVDEFAVVSGYGLQDVKIRINSTTGEEEVVGGYTDNRLKYAMVKIISNKQCQMKYWQSYIAPVHICGYAVQTSKTQHEGVCYGDSGGPLVHDDTIIGIVSTSPVSCEENKFPAIYTRVSPFVPFIRNIISGNPTPDARFFDTSARIYG